MKFSKHLHQNLLPEWAQYYVRYKHLKKLLKPLESASPPSNLPTITSAFLHALATDLRTLNTFTQSQRRALDAEAAALDTPLPPEELEVRLRALGRARHALLTFGELNLTAFYKSAKKHDKAVLKAAAGGSTPAATHRPPPLAILPRVMRVVEGGAFLKHTGVVLRGAANNGGGGEEEGGWSDTGGDSSDPPGEEGARGAGGLSTPPPYRHTDALDTDPWGVLLGDPELDALWPPNAAPPPNANTPITAFSHSSSSSRLANSSRSSLPIYPASPTILEVSEGEEMDGDGGGELYNERDNEEEEDVEERVRVRVLRTPRPSAAGVGVILAAAAAAGSTPTTFRGGREDEEEEEEGGSLLPLKITAPPPDQQESCINSPQPTTSDPRVDTLGPTFLTSLSALLRHTEDTLKLTAPELSQTTGAEELGALLQPLKSAIAASTVEFNAKCGVTASSYESLLALSLTLRVQLFPVALATLTKSLAHTSPELSGGLERLARGYKGLLWEGGVGGISSAGGGNGGGSSSSSGSDNPPPPQRPLSSSRRGRASSTSSTSSTSLPSEGGWGSPPPAAPLTSPPPQVPTPHTPRRRAPLVVIATPTRGLLTNEWGEDSQQEGSLGVRINAAPLHHRLWLRYRPQCLEWLSDYSVRKQWKGDLLAGITIGILIIPQGLVCATLAGVAPIYGLYSGLPAAIYAVFGASHHAAIGPMSVPSLMIFSGLASVFGDSDAAAGASAPPSPALYAARLATLTFQVGLLLFAMGWLQLGFILRFISRPVLQGFTTAAALLTVLSLASDFLGVAVPRGAVLHDILRNIGASLPGTSGPAVGLALGGIAALSAFAHYRVTTGTLVVMVVAMGGFGLAVGVGGATSPVKLVGPQPASLPPLLSPLPLPPSDFLRLLPVSIPVALVAFLESLAVAKAYSLEHGYDVSVQTELKALGFTNLCGACLHTLPILGALGRSSVGASMGGSSPLTGVVSALTVLLILGVAMPAIAYLPRPILAAVIGSGVVRLLGVGEFQRLWGADRRDFLVAVAACLATLFLGVVWGVAAAAGLSLALFLALTTQPRVEEVGRLTGTVVYKHLGMEGVSKVPGVKVLRFLAPLFFANASVLRERVMREILHRKPLPPRMKWHTLVLCLSAVASVDSSALAVLEECARACHACGTALVLASANAYVEDALRAAGTLRVLAGAGGGQGGQGGGQTGIPSSAASASTSVVDYTALGDTFLYRRVHDAVRAVLAGRVKVGGTGGRRRGGKRGGVGGGDGKDGAAASTVRSPSALFASDTTSTTPLPSAAATPLFSLGFVAQWISSLGGGGNPTPAHTSPSFPLNRG